MRQWDTKDHSCHCRDINPGDTNNNDDERLTSSHSPLSIALYLSEYRYSGSDYLSQGAHTMHVLTIRWSEHNWELSVPGYMLHVSPLRGPLRPAAQCEACQSLYAALRTHTEMGHQRGISTTKSTFSRPICTDKWIIHTLYCIGQCILLSNSGSAFTASLNFFCHSIHLDNDGLD